MISYNNNDGNVELTFKGSIEDTVSEILTLISRIYRSMDSENARRFRLLMKFMFVVQKDLIFSREQEEEEP